MAGTGRAAALGDSNLGGLATDVLAIGAYGDGRYPELACLNGYECDGDVGYLALGASSVYVAVLGTGTDIGAVYLAEAGKLAEADVFDGGNAYGIDNLYLLTYGTMAGGVQLDGLGVY